MASSSPTLLDDLYARLAFGTAPPQDYQPQLPAGSLPDDFEGWTRAMFPQYTSKPSAEGPRRHIPFAERHKTVLGWFWGLRPGLAPPALAACWPRGGAKSTTAQMGISAVAARRSRKYCIYLSEIQEKADDHVSTVGAMFESPNMAAYYPDVSNRLVTKHGTSKGWRRNRLRTASGFTIDALGLDSAARGAKIEEARPDLIVIDDVDDVDDSPGVIERKIQLLTRSILPAGSDDMAVLVIQNLIHGQGIMARLLGWEDIDKADWLADRITSGPFVGIENPKYEQRVDEHDGRRKWFITEGDPTWEGQDIPALNTLLNRIGLDSFDIEVQHNTRGGKKGMFGKIDFGKIEVDRHQVPTIIRWECWIDPAVSSKDSSDSQAIQIDGLGSDGRVYRFYSWEGIDSPVAIMQRAFIKCREYGCPTIGVETDQGGDTWESVYRDAWNDLVKSPDHSDFTEDSAQPGFKSEKAGATGVSKIERVGQQVGPYESDQVRHVRGTHRTLVNALERFGVRKPFDLADAAAWSLKALLPQADMLMGMIAQGAARGW